MPCRLVLSEHKSAGGEDGKESLKWQLGEPWGASECFRPRRDLPVWLPAGERGEGEMMGKGTPGKLSH